MNALITIPALVNRTVNITGAQEMGNTVTITTGAAHNFVAGQTVVINITGAGNAGYNGAFQITPGANANSFTYTLRGNNWLIGERLEVER